MNWLKKNDNIWCLTTIFLLVKEEFISSLRFFPSMYIFILKKNHILVSFKTVLELSIVKLSNCKCNTKPQHISDLKAKSGYFSAHDQKGALDELETPHCLL